MYQSILQNVKLATWYIFSCLLDVCTCKATMFQLTRNLRSLWYFRFDLSTSMFSLQIKHFGYRIHHFELYIHTRCGYTYKTKCIQENIFLFTETVLCSKMRSSHLCIMCKIGLIQFYSKYCVATNILANRGSRNYIYLFKFMELLK